MTNNAFKNCANIYELERAFDQLSGYQTIRNCVAVEEMEKYSIKIIADYREKLAEIKANENA